MSGPTTRSVLAALAALLLGCGAGEPGVPDSHAAESPAAGSGAAESPPPDRTTESPSIETSIETAPEVSNDAPTVVEGAPHAAVQASVEGPSPAGLGGAPSSDGSEPSRGVPRIRVSEARVGPAYPRELVRRVIRRHFDDVRRCFERHAPENLCVDGVTIEFTIEGDGAVGQRSARSSREGHPLAPETAACFERAFGDMRFPSPPGQSRMYIRYPLLVNCAG